MDDRNRKERTPQQTAKRFNVVKLEERIAPGQSHFPPGQFPGGNPAQSGGASNDPGKSGK